MRYSGNTLCQASLCKIHYRTHTINHRDFYLKTVNFALKSELKKCALVEPYGAATK